MDELTVFSALLPPQCLVKALNNRRRQWAPSKQEILCTINRRPIYARFHFMDGQFHSLEFDASATTSDVVDLIKHKIGLKETTKGTFKDICM